MTVEAPPRLPVRVDPAFAEALVRRVVTGGRAPDPEAVERHARRLEPLYAIAAGRERAGAFERTALAEFEELGLADEIRSAVEERAAVAGRVRVVLLGEAGGRRDEGVTWEPSGAHLGVRVEASRFDDAMGLRAWLRHVLGHAEDTLDPGFGFKPGLAESALAGAAQARLHDLWDVSVDGRSTATGIGPPDGARERHRSRLAAQLREHPPEVIEVVLDRLWSGPRPTYAELVTWAADRMALASGRSGTALGERPDRCPLCRFPGDDISVPEPSRAALVAADYPDWRPERGLCGRCGDRYRFIDGMGGHP